MRKFVVVLMVVGASLLSGLPGGAWKLAAQSSGAATSAIPRTPDGKPDFSGFWDSPKAVGIRNAGATVFDKGHMASFKPGGEALFFEPRTGDPRHDEPRAFCAPTGFPSNLFAPYPLQIVQNRGYFVMVPEFMSMPRLIPLDGRPHRKDLEPTYYGEAVGRWEGDTLVIDTNNFHRWSLDDYYYVNPKEYRMHSDAFHTIERIQFTDAKTLSYQMTIDDPKIFTATWSQDFTMQRRPPSDNQLFEFVCEENNRCPGGKCEK